MHNARCKSIAYRSSTEYFIAVAGSPIGSAIQRSVLSAVFRITGMALGMAIVSPNANQIGGRDPFGSTSLSLKPVTDTIAEDY
jgi:hypothetical protein